MNTDTLKTRAELLELINKVVEEIVLYEDLENDEKIPFIEAATQLIKKL